MVKHQTFLHFSPIDPSWSNEIKYDTKKDIDLKVRTLLSGKKTWQQTGYTKRAEILRKLIVLLEKSRGELNALIRLETGKVKMLCEAEFDSAISMIRILTAYEFFPKGLVLPSANANRLTYTSRTPFGLALLIFPSNAPLPNFIWKLAPALMAGNVILAKPSPFTAKTFEFLLELFRKAGVGEEVVQRIDGEEDQLKELVSHNLDLISFTGSTVVGKKITHLEYLNFPKMILECGGINPFIVFEDTNLDQCIPIFINSAFGNSGQRCSAASLTLIENSILDEFVVRLQEKMSKYSIGTEAESDFGPMCSSTYVTRLNNFLNRLPNESILSLGKILSVNSSVSQPKVTLLSANCDPSLITTEIYGPISRIIGISSASEAIDIVSNTRYGLTAAIWTHNDTKKNEFKSNLSNGVINFNGPTFGSEPNFPFGGVGMSGNGTKDAGYDSIDEYSYSRVISEFTYDD